MLKGEREVIVITEAEEEQRLDKILSQRFPEQSRTYFQMLIETGMVMVNSSRIKKRAKPRAGDRVEIEFILTPEMNLEPEAIPLEILFEDEHLLAINKPVGMVVHPAPGHWSGTFVHALLYHCKWTKDYLDDPLRPGIVHRLDKDTSGVLLAAKTRQSHQALVHLFSQRQIEKSYLAICIGKPQAGLINQPIGRHPVKRKEMQVQAAGKPAETEIRVVGWNGKLSCVLARPKTGRTHQIRVHLQALGTPILGDSVYGSDQVNKKHGSSRQLLHAWRLEFRHPIHNRPLLIEAPLPSDLLELIQKIDPQILTQLTKKGL